MPQMAPLYWVTLFIMFLMLFIFSSIKIYFSCTQSMSLTESDNKLDKNKLNKNNQTTLNWKW